MIAIDADFEDEGPVYLLDRLELLARLIEGRPPADFVIDTPEEQFLPHGKREAQIPIYGDAPEPEPLEKVFDERGYPAWPRPGTEERKELYAQRYAKRQQLHCRGEPGEHPRVARRIRVTPNGRPLVTGEALETHLGLEDVA